MDKKVNYSNWFEGYFGKGTRKVTAYLDNLNRLFLIPDNQLVLPKEHYCDRMGCGTAGPHIIGVYLPSERIYQLQTENEELKKDVKILRVLEAGGVDNWEGYDSALDLLDQ